jgi:hypothetical protein
VLACTALHQRKVTWLHRKGTVREALEEVEALTGGVWHRIGKIYALQPNSQVERLARVGAEWRQAAIIQILGQFQESLTREQRERLQRHGLIEARNTTAAQKALLRRAGLVLFVAVSDLAPSLLQSDEIRVRLADPAPGSEERTIEYRARTRAGDWKVVFSAPFQRYTGRASN